MRVSRLAVTLFLVGSSTLCSCAADNYGCSGDLDVYSQSDLTALASCHSYNGTITVDSTAASALILPGVTVFHGDIIVKNNTALGSMAFPKLQVIDGALRFSGNIALSKLDWPSLWELKELDLSVLPSLASISFPSGLYAASKIAVLDTTAAKFDGLKIANISEVAIVNNRYLKTVDLGDKLKQVTKDITVGANSPDLSLDLSNLKELQQGTLSNLADLSLTGLEKVHGDMSLLSNNYQSFEMPKLVDMAGSLTLANNSKLEKLSVPELRHLGGALSISNNARLTSLDAFPKLEEIDGTLDLTGSFNETKLPSLQDVRGGLNVQTSDDAFSCDGINNFKHGVIKGNDFVCKAGIIEPKSGIHKSSTDYNGKSGSIAANVKSHPAHIIFISTTILCLSIL